MDPVDPALLHLQQRELWRGQIRGEALAHFKPAKGEDQSSSSFGGREAWVVLRWYLLACWISSPGRDEQILGRESVEAQTGSRVLLKGSMP